VRFKFIEEHKDKVPIQRLCQIMNVSARGYRSYRTRPISQSQRTDMVLLAHIRDQFAQNHNCYGRVRMTEELKDLGLQVGHPLPVGDCMQSPIGPCRQTDASESGRVSTRLQTIIIISLTLHPTCWIVILQQIGPIKNGL
jgi:hypothetical protein